MRKVPVNPKARDEGLSVREEYRRVHLIRVPRHKHLRILMSDVRPVQQCNGE